MIKATSQKQELAAWLREAIEKSGTTQATLARFLNETPQVVNRMVNNKREIKAREAMAIARHLGVDLPAPHFKNEPTPGHLDVASAEFRALVTAFAKKYDLRPSEVTAVIEDYLKGDA